MMEGTGLKWKICGMREMENISEVVQLGPDYMGFIFYQKSPRFVRNMDKNEIRFVKSQGVEPVAVFVDAPVEFMTQVMGHYGFTHVQLHGKESPQVCAELKAKGYQVIKALNVAEVPDLEPAILYEGLCDFFLFDTRTVFHGGSGHSFDWDILKEYAGTTPFFLSGGIGPDDARKIRKFRHPRLWGIDLNSRFEKQPALKDVQLLKNFIDQLISQK